MAPRPLSPEFADRACHREERSDVAIRHNVSSRGIEDAVAISTKIFILEIAAAGVAGLATTKCRIATPSRSRVMARNDTIINGL